MVNHLILNRLAGFQLELKRKEKDTGFTVNETRFICERATILIKDYCSPGMGPLKERTLAKLQTVMEKADLYYASYNRNKQQTTVSFTQVVGPAEEAITYFLAKAK